MNLRSIQPARPLLLAALFLLASAATVRADVQDGGGFFSQDAVQQADQTLNKLRRETGKEFVIETFATPPAGVDAANLSQSFSRVAERRAQKNHVDGVYMIVCKNPSFLYAKSGNATAKQAFTVADVNRLSKTMRAAFEQRDFDGGLSKGVALVDQTVRSNLNAGSAPAAAAGVNSGKIQQFPSRPGTARPDSGQAANDMRNGGPGAPVRDAPKSGGSGFGTIFWIIVGVVVIGAIYFGLKLFTGRSSGSSGQAAVGRTPPAGGFGAPGNGGTGGSLGGGMGGGLLGGLLGGAAGNLLGGVFGNRSSSGNSSARTAAPPPTDSGGGTFDDSVNADTSFDTTGSGGSFGGGADSAADAGGGESFSGDDNNTGSGGSF